MSNNMKVNSQMLALVKAALEYNANVVMVATQVIGQTSNEQTINMESIKEKLSENIRRYKQTVDQLLAIK